MQDRHEGKVAADRRSCPTCDAPRQGGAICHRCKSDLSLLLRLEQQVDALRQRARRCYARGWYREAAWLAQTSLCLEFSAEDLRLLACAQLLCGDFARAWRTYLKLA